LMRETNFVRTIQQVQQVHRKSRAPSPPLGGLTLKFCVPLLAVTACRNVTPPNASGFMFPPYLQLPWRHAGPVLLQQIPPVLPPNVLAIFAQLYKQKCPQEGRYGNSIGICGTRFLNV
jgi:hypothetical protein